ncbi:MAG: hypothetical protein ACREJC_08465, partial [Tepidisphaeraceae bacterium]
PSSVLIDQQPFVFPLAKLAVQESDGKVLALLFSDDPRDAISDKYTGNSFYLEMELDVPDAKDFASAIWQFKAPSSDWEDSPYGIFLDGHRRRLAPKDVKVQFEPAGPNLTTVYVSGQFLMLGVNDPVESARVVPVVARLQAATKVK